MSVERCIAALTGLNSDLERIAAEHSGTETMSFADRADALLDLIRDLTLDVDLRRGTVLNPLMTAVEAAVYLPVVEKVLLLLKRVDLSLPLAGVCMEEAKALTLHGLKEAAVGIA